MSENKCYLFDEQTGEYLGKETVHVNPKGGGLLLPPNGTTSPAPEYGENQIPVWDVNGKFWTVKEDHRHRQFFRKDNREPERIEKIGEEPGINLTDTAPRPGEVWMRIYELPDGSIKRLEPGANPEKKWKLITEGWKLSHKDAEARARKAIDRKLSAAIDELYLTMLSEEKGAFQQLVQESSIVLSGEKTGFPLLSSICAETGDDPLEYAKSILDAHTELSAQKGRLIGRARVIRQSLSSLSDEQLETFEPSLQ